MGGTTCAHIYIVTERGADVPYKATEFGKLLREIRKENNESQIDMAERLRTSVLRLDAIEKRTKGAEATLSEIENVVRKYDLPKGAYEKIIEIIEQDRTAGNGLSHIFENLDNAAFTNFPKK
jgi:transcriptional regulator with XRE-family HTH domain